MGKQLQRRFRDRPLTPQEVAKDQQIRAKVKQEFPPAPSSTGRSASHYKVALLESDEGFCAWVPELPGCCSQGATDTEALHNIEIAIRDYLAVAQKQHGEFNVREVEVIVAG